MQVFLSWTSSPGREALTPGGVAEALPTAREKVFLVCQAGPSLTGKDPLQDKALPGQQSGKEGPCSANGQRRSVRRHSKDPPG